MIFILGYPNSCKGALKGDWGASGGLGPVPSKILCYVNSVFINREEIKNDFHCPFRVLPGGLGKLSLIPPEVMCYVNHGISNSGDSTNDLRFRITS